MKRALVIGHNIASQGAYGDKGISEFKFWSKMVKDLMDSEELKASDNEFKVFWENEGIRGYTRRMVELHQRIDAWGAGETVEAIGCHFNGSSNQKVHGHEVLYASQNGRRIAVKLDILFDKYLDNNDRNLVKRTQRELGGAFLWLGRSYCVIIEPFFASWQHKYVEGGEMRENLITALSEHLIS